MTTKGLRNVGNLEYLEKFEYEGVIYTRRRILAGQVLCLTEDGASMITLSPKTKVKPVIVEEGEETGEETGEEAGEEAGEETGEETGEAEEKTEEELKNNE